MCSSKQTLLLIMLTMSFSAFSEEAVTYRYNGDFKIGKKYPILQYRANVRAGPSVNSNAIAILSLHDRVEILEYTEVNEEINHVFAWWYKIKYGNITGYTFGGNLSSETLSVDMDKNGINDYFYFRFVYQQNGNAQSDTRRDIIIYINDQPINTAIHRGMPDDDPDDYEYEIDWCYFVEKNGHILIYLEDYGRDSYAERTVYKVGQNGTMEFIEYLVGYADYDPETGGDLFHFDYRQDKDGYWFKRRRVNDENVIIEQREIDGEIWARVEWEDFY